MTSRRRLLAPPRAAAPRRRLLTLPLAALACGALSGIAGRRAIAADLPTVVAASKPSIVGIGIYAPLQSFKLQLGASIDSNPTSAATGKANANTTATLTASLHF